MDLGAVKEVLEVRNNLNNLDTSIESGCFQFMERKIKKKNYQACSTFVALRSTSNLVFLSGKESRESKTLILSFIGVNGEL